MYLQIERKIRPKIARERHLWSTRFLLRRRMKFAGCNVGGCQSLLKSYKAIE